MRQEKKVKKSKLISINESEYDVIVKIAKKQGYVYPDGHKDAGKIIPRMAIEYLVKNFQEPIA
jgi:hypothetical protein